MVEQNWEDYCTFHPQENLSDSSCEVQVDVVLWMLPFPLSLVCTQILLISTTVLVCGFSFYNQHSCQSSPCGVSLQD